MFSYLFLLLATAWILCMLIGVALKKYSRGVFVETEKAAAENANNIFVWGLAYIGVIFLGVKTDNSIVKYIGLSVAAVFALIDIIRFIIGFVTTVALCIKPHEKLFATADEIKWENRSYVVLLLSNFIELCFFVCITCFMFRAFFLNK